jgi:hypothetical protein
MPTTQSPELSPDYALHRDGVAAVELDATVRAAGVGYTKKSGMNLASYEHAHIQVIPSGGANPDVTVWWWSEAASAWVQEHTPLTRAGVGANTPFEFTIQPRGRRFFVSVPTLAAGAVSVYVAGFRTTIQPVA